MCKSLRAGRMDPERGQIIVVFALALIALVAAVALVIEGGNVFGQQRIAQNGADATSTAGAVIVAEKLSGKARSGADVAAAITTASTENNLESFTAEYTDDFGTPIGQAVDAALPDP